MDRGFVKIWRKMHDNPRMNDPYYLSLFVHLLLSATHKPVDKIFKKQRIKLSPGQLITSRYLLAKKTGINSSKIERILKVLEIEQQIEQRTCSVNRLITITNWAMYQQSEPQSEQRVNHERTTSEPPKNKNERNKNINNIFINRARVPRTCDKARPKDVAEVNEYCRSLNRSEYGQQFIDHYESVGWVYGKSKHPIKDWKAACRNWRSFESKQAGRQPLKTQEPITIEEL